MQIARGNALISEGGLKLIRKVLLTLSVLGMLIFGSLFAVTFAKQDSIERVGESFVKYQVQKTLSGSDELLSQNKYGKALQGLKDKMLRDESLTQSLIKTKFDEHLADVIAQFCRLDCDGRRNIAQSVRKGLESKLSRLGISLNVVEDLIADKYDATLTALKRDLRIFLGTNVAAFLLIGLLLCVKRKATAHLVFPSALLSVSVIISSVLYIFKQNWFFTILYGSYWGIAYTVYLLLIFLFLLDIAFNKGRVTAKIIELISNAFSNGISIGLC